ncbi:hypothetical protein DC347_02125 [Pseudarthrobacter sp. AG30]|uniref:4'-phosphopantetheinyl transferase family protein n=1 Tax=Micrococcaceae TaxID=1268 RepID=UPI000D65EF9D|nr:MULTISPECIES: 4'-phosphopantetheinyl transferase superfamily protein [Micrococcaceae]RAX18286.1 hypothetical protein DC347_02125 [Pseudarthrobacter sp. AG30]TDT85829.1 4'-phosphopantetheinyl transferase [Arthrobacter sp. AG258]
MSGPHIHRAGTVFAIARSSELEEICEPTGGFGAYISAAEAESALRFTRAGDRLDYLASHALFRLLAANRLGRHPGDAPNIEVTRRCPGCGSTGHGKPAVAGVSLSLSRSHGAVMAAAGPDAAGVGADIEKFPDILFDGFDEYAASPAERSELQPGDVPARIRLWVAKETVLKAAGLGLAVAPSTVHLAPVWSLDAGSFLRAESPGHPEVHGMGTVPVAAPPGYAAAVSVSANQSPTRLPLARLLHTASA